MSQNEFYKNKTVWLIGASTGIGKETAIKLAQHGAKLILSSRSEDKLNEILKILEKDGYGSEHKVVAFDITDEEACKEAFGKASRGSGFDIFIYNSGYYNPSQSNDYNVEKSKDAILTIDVNLNGYLRILGHIIPFFKERKSGHIAVTASVAGYFGLPNAFSYGASKAALINISEIMHAELVKDNIKVQVINPGFVKTPMTEKNDFPMPMAIEPKEAAENIVKGLSSNSFEIHFPKGFSYILKFIRLLPYFLFFPITKAISRTNDKKD